MKIKDRDEAWAILPPKDAKAFAIGVAYAQRLGTSKGKVGGRVGHHGGEILQCLRFPESMLVNHFVSG